MRSLLLPYYPLDLASVLAVHTLGARRGDRVFDLCAAPGGKALALALMLEFDYSSPTAPPSTAPPTPAATQSFLHANDSAPARRKRLTATLKAYLPAPVYSDGNALKITGLDATTTPVPDAAFDRVLLDAPCSTDRHVLHSNKEMEEWSPGRFKRDAARQVALLLQGLRAAKVGATIVYSTCSLCPQENDHIIDAVRAQCDKWIAKGRVGRDGTAVDFVVERIGGADDVSAAVRMPFGEPTTHGWMFLPDQPMPAATSGAAAETAHGFGPLYVCRLRRVAVRT